MKDFTRRRLLRGIGGATLALPMLDMFRAHEARAAAATSRKVYSVFMIQANGVVQGLDGSDGGDRFWPRGVGPLSDATMRGADKDRATSELAGHASKLLMVKGINYAASPGVDNHAGGTAQALTAAGVPAGSSNKALALGESVDNRIARALTPGREPLTLYAGRKPAYIMDALSYRGPKDVRVGDNNPWNVYSRIVGLVKAGDPTTARRVLSRRRSINDAVRAELQDLMKSDGLSAEDRTRLDLHFSSVRDLEQGMTKQLGEADVALLQGIDGKHQDNDRMEAVTRLQLDLLAFALASDITRTGTLQIGAGSDGTRYIVDGTKLPPYHQISHRIYSDGAAGARIAGAADMHHQIDRIHARHFKHLLDRLSSYTLPEGGTLLDSCMAVWCNSLSNGPPHSMNAVPWIIGGSGGGFLRTGQVVDVKSVHNNKLLNTILAASGVQKDDGSPIDDFGDKNLSRGLLSQIHRV